MNSPADHDPGGVEESGALMRETPGVSRSLGILAAVSSGILLVASALWCAWKGPFVGFDPVRVWSILGGIAFFGAMAGFVLCRHHLTAWRWFVVAIVHSLALAAFGKFVDETGIAVEYQRWILRGSWSQPSSLTGLLSLYVIGALVTAIVSFRILRRHAG